LSESIKVEMSYKNLNAPAGKIEAGKCGATIFFTIPDLLRLLLLLLGGGVVQRLPVLFVNVLAGEEVGHHLDEEAVRDLSLHWGHVH
jgi:hypothetical protein